MRTFSQRIHVREYKFCVSLLGNRIHSRHLNRLRRNIKWKTNPSFVYLNDVITTGRLLIANAPLEGRTDLVGCYFGSVSSDQLREDLTEAASA